MFHVYNLRVTQLFSAASAMVSLGNLNYGGMVGDPALTAILANIDNSKESIIDQSKDLIGMIKSGEHAVAETIADVEEDKRPRLQRLIGW
jgi:hypothetical protein